MVFKIKFGSYSHKHYYQLLCWLLCSGKSRGKSYSPSAADDCASGGFTPVDVKLSFCRLFLAIRQLAVIANVAMMDNTLPAIAADITEWEKTLHAWIRQLDTLHEQKLIQEPCSHAGTWKRYMATTYSQIIYPVFVVQVFTGITILNFIFTWHFSCRNHNVQMK